MEEQNLPMQLVELGIIYASLYYVHNLKKAPFSAHFGLGLFEPTSFLSYTRQLVWYQICESSHLTEKP